MPEFKVIAGDFGQNVKGNVCVGQMYRVSAQGFRMPIPGHSFQTQHIRTGQIETLELGTEENLKKLAGSIGWGFLGGLALGPIGALAGVLAGGRKTELTFLCQFKDGRRFLGQCDVKTYTAIQAARFEVQPKGKASPPQAVVLGILVMLAILFGVIVSAVHDTASAPVASRAQNLNQSAVSFATYVVADDMTGMLVRDLHSPVWPKVETLLGWLKLDWSLPATNYEADYAANEIAADNDFKGKRILVTGTISSISKDFADQGYVTLRGSGLMGVRAQLSDTGKVGAASFRRGQQVNLVCTGSGRVVTIATLDSCESLDDYISGLSPSLQTRVADYLAGEKPFGSVDGLPVVLMYIVGEHLPHDSPCLNGNRSSCMSEMKSLLANKGQLEEIQAEAKAMLASLKTN